MRNPDVEVLKVAPRGVGGALNGVACSFRSGFAGGKSRNEITHPILRWGRDTTNAPRFLLWTIDFRLPSAQLLPVTESFTNNKEAQRLAKKLLAEARAHEPAITAALQTIAHEVAADLFGLEHKFKTGTSLLRKLTDAAGDNSAELRRKAKSVNDILRYTFVLPFEVYAVCFRQTRERLREFGYYIPERRIWNAWQTIGERFDRGYRGINITVISLQKQKFELQFHTAASFALKTETHFLYEELRRKEISEERQVELIEELKNAAKSLLRPEGV